MADSEAAVAGCQAGPKVQVLVAWDGGEVPGHEVLTQGCRGRGCIALVDHHLDEDEVV
jgi:hypothetical protein